MDTERGGTATTGARAAAAHAGADAAASAADAHEPITDAATTTTTVADAANAGPATAANILACRGTKRALRRTKLAGVD